MLQRPRVRVVRCDHRADDEAVYQAVCRAVAPLDAAWQRLVGARRIALKINQDKMPDAVVWHAGQRQQLVSDAVVRAVLRVLRERTSAELVCVDTSFYALYNGRTAAETCTIAPVLREFAVPFIDGTTAPVRQVAVPGGGAMFARYPILAALLDADAVVSLATIKNHVFTGITGCLKNLFGTMPGEPAGRPRTYYHHLVRMPYVLADIGRILQPALNIVDALVGQAGQEWSAWAPAEPLARVVDALIAGDHVIATDAVMAHLMGHDPAADWRTPPFHRDRNALRVAAEHGFGTVDLAAIDWHSDVPPQVAGRFFAIATDAPARTWRWQQTMAEQALFYDAHRERFARYAGAYILLQDGAVQWHGRDGAPGVSRRALAHDRPDHAIWFKYVDPDEAEGEQFAVYRQRLAALAEAPPPS
jgi:uncharacterized protein (DUF362 family)